MVFEVEIMNRESYEQLIADAKNEASETIGNNTSPQRIEYAMDILAQRVAAVTRDYHLTNLMGVDDVAERLGVDVSAIRHLLIRRNEEAPLGMKIGKNTWVVDIDELPMLEQDRRRKTSAL